jgi:hypothetical protein
VNGRPASSLLVFFSGILGFSPNCGGFRRPGNYTSHLSALIYCIRLLILERAIPLTAHSALGWPQRPWRAQHERFRRFHRQLLCFGSPTAVGEILSLRAYGRQISRTQGAAFKFFWSDDGQTVKWDQYTYTMATFRQLSQQILDTASQSCCRLMYDWQPPVDLASLRDRFANLEEGYSFRTEPTNHLMDAYLQLSDRACAAHVDGLMDSNGWNLAAAGRYLA